MTMFGEDEEPQVETRDTEITLGTGKLLGLFFGLAVLCALCFGIGYQLGRNYGKNNGPLITDGTMPATTGSTAKPAGGIAEAKPAASPEASAEATPTPDLSFYKSVEQKQPNTTLEKPEAAPTPAQQPAPEMARPASSGGYLVQVAAVTKQEDAQALADALKKKNYPVFIASNPSADKYFRVQIGPFPDINSAESTRRKLVSDGYNPILKK